MPKTPRGYEAWIEVEGQRIQEFQVEMSEENTRVMCWIPCEVGKVGTPFEGRPEPPLTCL